MSSQPRTHTVEHSQDEICGAAHTPSLSQLLAPVLGPLMEATDGSDGPILFACTAHAGQIDPLLAIAGELSRRGVPGLWFASTGNRRVDIEGAAVGSPIHFVSCGINDRTKELIEDPAFYAAFAQRGPMTTDTFVLAMRWMFDQERLNRSIASSANLSVSSSAGISLASGEA